MNESIEALQKRIRELQAHIKIIEQENERQRRDLIHYRDRLNGKPARKIMMSVPARTV